MRRPVLPPESPGKRILCVWHLKPVEMCCEGPEAMAAGAYYLLAAGPCRLPLRLPWVAGGSSSLA